MTTALLLVCAIALAAQSAQALPHPLLDLYDNQSPDSITEETEQVAEMDANEISAFETEVLDTQAVTITNCGLAGSHRPRSTPIRTFIRPEFEYRYS